MTEIEKRILARRQRDLDNYINKYQDELQNWAGEFSKKLLPSWKSMEGRLNIRIKDLYKKMGAIEDPEKLKQLQTQTKRLEALAAQLVNDIKQVEATYQPAFTGALKHQFEKAYYGTAYGLEQAAKVAVTVPVLTPTQILGVTANPWLNDGANYSSRLRANTTNLASSVKMAVLEAVKEGQPWDKTARRISQLSGEGYHNAVRLARTELNRAAALGSSMLYMENADVLDGKRWNATLDSRTAPKDAKNDNQIYDLDYDTPESPGIPGQRIPNHPNCRCVWSPVLSALGVSDGPRIGRGENDTPDHFGQREYFKATNYEDYAKKRGLPSLEDRLQNDSINRYLRPGETAADALKTVTKWKHKGGEISVPVPEWLKEVPKATTTAVVQTVGQAATVKKIDDASKNMVKLEYKVATSITEAEAYAQQITGAYKISYKGIDLEQANEFNRGFHAVLSEMPELKGFVQEIGPTKATKSYAFFETSGEVAQSSLIASEKRIALDNRLVFSKALTGDKAAFDVSVARDIKGKFHFDGMTAAHIAAHEYTHAIEALLDYKYIGAGAKGKTIINGDQSKKLFTLLGNNSTAADIANEAYKRLGIRPIGREAYDAVEPLGRYAMKNKGELLAQAVADGLLSKNPQPFSLKVVEIVKEMLKK